MAGDSPRVFDQPNYYDIAFSFRDYVHETGVMEEAIRRYSGCSVRRVLEVGCGNAPHMLEWLRRGYGYVGLDNNAHMIAYAQAKAEEVGAAAELLLADMTSFALAEPVDFAYVLLGSLYVQNSAELDAHFDRVARALRPGGLYLLDWVVDFDPLGGTGETWEEAREGVHVRTTVLHTPVDRVEQTLEEKVILEVDDDGLSKNFVECSVKRAIYPQEFLLLMRQRDDFEFAGWWDAWDLDSPVDGTRPTHRAITVIRRTEVSVAG